MARTRTPGESALELLERDVELDEIRACLDDACGGAGRMLLVEGAAGIGKTRLLGRARELARELGMTVISARGTELEQEFAFGVVRQLFEPVLFAATSEERTSLFDGAALAAADVFERADVAADPGAPGDTTFTTLAGLYWLLANVAESGPVALIVDDVHWCDRSSQRLFRFLLPRLDGLAVAVVVAGRPAESELLAELASDPTAMPLALAPLSVSAVGAVVRARFGPAADDGFCEACRRASGGNPFLLGELLTELAAGGTRGTASDIAAVHDVAPRSVQRAFVTRIARLGDDVGAYARAVAVLGDGVGPALLASFAELEPAAAGRAGDTLVEAGILESGRPARFLHPLIRNAVYASIGRGELAAAHARAADLLRCEAAEPEQVAVHLLRTDERVDQDGSALLVEAARRAIARSAPDAAVAYLRRALVERLDPGSRAHALRLLVGAARAALDATALDGISADPVVELSGERDLRAAHALAQWLHMSGHGSDALRVIDAALSWAQPADDPVGVLLLESQRTLIAQVPPTSSQERIERLADHAPAGSDAERLLLALRCQWTSLRGDSAAEAVRLARGALAGGSVFADYPGAAAPTYIPFVLLVADELDAAEESFAQWRAATRGREGLFAAVAASAGEAYMALARGEVALAEARFQAGLELLREAGASTLALWFIGALVETLVERGDLDGAQRALQDAELDADLPDGYWVTEIRLARGRLRVAQGRTHEALEDFFAVRDYVERSQERNPAWFPWASAAAPALVATGRTEEARGFVEDELERARRWGAAAPIGRALRALGVVEGDLELLREAVGVLEHSPRRLEYIRAQCDLGVALRRRRERVAAREPLRIALAEARRRGALALAQRAADELAATGETVREPLSSGVESLTPSERRIAGIAADGLSNREIAQSLFVSVKTVETHLSSVYRKLDIAGRAELAAALAR